MGGPRRRHGKQHLLTHTSLIGEGDRDIAAWSGGQSRTELAALCTTVPVAVVEVGELATRARWGSIHRGAAFSAVETAMESARALSASNEHPPLAAQRMAVRALVGRRGFLPAPAGKPQTAHRDQSYE